MSRRIVVFGATGYDFTARILAWAAMCVADRDLGQVGALGPVEAFGLRELEAGCATAGIRRGVADRPLPGRRLADAAGL